MARTVPDPGGPVSFAEVVEPVGHVEGLPFAAGPLLRSGNLVALEIEQRIEDLLTTQSSTTPITSKREIKTSVLVANGQTVILGGMIKETEKALRNRVPFFSYIPILGGLFKSNEKQKEKIDLMIFLTPYIIKTPQDATNITNQIINDQQQLSPAELKQLKDNHENYQKSLKKEEVKKEILDPTTLIQGEEQQTPAETTK